MKGLASRKLAVEVLTAVEVDKAYANIALSSAFKRKTLSERDRAFVTALVQGVLRHRDELDADIGKRSSQPLNKITPPVRNVLRMAFFQLKYMPDIPAAAVVNTATEVGKTVGHAGIGKFVTGVLRGYVRERETKSEDGHKEANEETAAADDTPAALALRYSVPQWLVERWLQQRGRDQTESLLKFSQAVPPLMVRACESGITTDALVNLFTSHGIKVRRGQLVDSCLIIEDRGKYKGPVDKLPGYADGLFIVQDEAAAFASQAVDAKPGETVVDLCAAPGGKAVHMAEMMEGKGRVLAVDLHENRLNLLKQTRQRVGLTNIQVYAADGTTFDPGAPADRVLIDAPCMGTGVINRRSDLRFKRQAPDVEALVDLQRRLLSHAAEIIRDGGVLVYSTCSIEPEENEQNLRWFLDCFPHFSLSSLKPFAAPGFVQGPHGDELERGWIQLLPSDHGMSGFFVARLIKSGM
jgi:16S rRNA (cytosine967-C5)-methyltransferase